MSLIGAKSNTHSSTKSNTQSNKRVERSLLDMTKRQYFYKLKAYMGLFFSLILAQMIALLFSMGGVGNSSMSMDGLNMRVSTYSGDIIIVFTLLWAFMIAIQFTTKVYRDIDFTFVSNRLSSNVSSIGYLATASLVGAIAAMLLTIVHKIVVYIYVGAANITGENFIVTPYELLLGTLVVALYMLLVSGFGYLIGIIAQINRMFVVLLPSIFFGTLILETRMKAEESIMIKTVQFYAMESSFTIFVLKILITASVFFASATFLSNRLEVRQ